MSFGSFDNHLKFNYEGIDITITEVEMPLYENFLVNDTSLRKYKVDFRYPRTAKEASLGHYEEETTYVLARSGTEAKIKLINLLRNRRKYLQNLRLRHMAMKAEPVLSWPDYVDFLNHVSHSKRSFFEDPKEMMGVEDFMIIKRRAQLRGDHFIDDLRKLPLQTQRLIQDIYKRFFNGGDNDEVMGKRLARIGKKDRAGEIPEKYQKKPEEISDENPSNFYWSVFEDEILKMDPREMPVKEIRKALRKLGVPGPVIAQQFEAIKQEMLAKYEAETGNYKNAIEGAMRLSKASGTSLNTALSLINHMSSTGSTDIPKELKRRFKGKDLDLADFFSMHRDEMLKNTEQEINKNVDLAWGNAEPYSQIRDSIAEMVSQLYNFVKPRYENNPAGFTKFLNWAVAGAGRTIPAFRNYATGSGGGGGYSQAMHKNFDIDYNKKQGMVQPRASSVSVTKTGTYVKMTYKAENAPPTIIYFEPDRRGIIRVKINNLVAAGE